MEKTFVSLKGEEKRYFEEVDLYIYSMNKYQFPHECRRKARGEMDFFQFLTNESGRCLEADFWNYSHKFENARFSGKLIIRPFNTLYEAAMDGVCGCYDSGLIAEGISEDDGYLFVVRIPGYEKKTFGYVLYNKNGEIIKARQAFNLDIKNRTILKYLELFSRDILIPELKKIEREGKTA